MAKKSITIALEETVIKDLQERAKTENRSLSNLIETILLKNQSGNENKNNASN